MEARTLPDNFPFKKETPQIFINCGFPGFFQLRLFFICSRRQKFKPARLQWCKLILELFKRQPLLIVCQNCTFFRQIWDLMRPGKLCASLTHLKKDQDSIIAAFPPTRRQLDLFKDLLYLSSQNRIIRIKVSYQNIIILPDDRIHFIVAPGDRQLNAWLLWIKLVATTIFALAWILPKGNSTHESLHENQRIRLQLLWWQHDINTVYTCLCDLLSGSCERGPFFHPQYFFIVYNSISMSTWDYSGNWMRRRRRG